MRLALAILAPVTPVYLVFWGLSPCGGSIK
jgi:hypothetical protein